jgi:hypothetical protein
MNELHKLLLAGVPFFAVMRTRFLLVSLFCLAACCPLNADLVQWTVNGHWYEAVPVVEGMTWADAEADAVAQGGYLATITSAAEAAFVYGLANADPSLWVYGGNSGPWLGGFQPTGSLEPAGGWQWVTGEAWSYTDWRLLGGSYTEPNNSHGNEESLQLVRDSSWGSIHWNDTSGSSSPVGWVPHGYILEVAPVPEPSSLSLALVWALLFGARLLRRRA